MQTLFCWKHQLKQMRNGPGVGHVLQQTDLPLKRPLLCPSSQGDPCLPSCLGHQDAPSPGARMFQVGRKQCSHKQSWSPSLCLCSLAPPGEYFNSPVLMKFLMKPPFILSEHGHDVTPRERHHSTSFRVRNSLKEDSRHMRHRQRPPSPGRFRTTDQDGAGQVTLQGLRGGPGSPPHLLAYVAPVSLPTAFLSDLTASTLPKVCGAFPWAPPPWSRGTCQWDLAKLWDSSNIPSHQMQWVWESWLWVTRASPVWGGASLLQAAGPPGGTKPLSTGPQVAPLLNGTRPQFPPLAASYGRQSCWRSDLA